MQRLLALRANVVIAALREPDGRLRGFGKVTRDLTSRRQAEQTELALMREQAARLAAEAAENRVRVAGGATGRSASAWS